MLMLTGTIIVKFGKMLCTREGIGNWQTAREPFTVAIQLSDGRMLTDNGACAIPETKVNGIPPYQEVEACVGSGGLSDGGTILFKIPNEPVMWGLAEEVPVSGSVQLSTGEVFEISGKLPSAKTTWHGIVNGKVTFEAEAVIFAGTLTQK
jgi:hypothetical protein